MKVYIIGDNKKDNKILSEKLSKLYDVKNFNIDVEESIQKKEINKIIKENKEWIIESDFTENSNIIASNASTIIYLKIEKNRLFKKEELKLPNEIIDFLKKYSSKILILKSEKEIEKLIKAIYERFEL